MSHSNPVRIAIVAQAGPELQKLRIVVHNPARFMVREFLSLQEVSHGLSEFAFEILLIRIPVFALDHVQMLEKIRSVDPAAGLITITAEIEPQARYRAQRVSRHKLISEGMEFEDLPKIIELMKIELRNKSEPSPLRQHPRTRRDGEVDVVDEVSGLRWQGRFLDCAQMGARLVIHTRTRILKHTHLRLSYRSSSDPRRMHHIVSKVVWEGMTGGMMESIVRGPQQVLGLRFIAAL